MKTIFLRISGTLKELTMRRDHALRTLSSRSTMTGQVPPAPSIVSRAPWR